MMEAGELKVTLNSGCQISESRFSVFWKEKNVLVTSKEQKMSFELKFNSEKYKLELPYRNIRQVELYRSHDQSAKILLIQLFGAPLIYKVLTAENVRTKVLTAENVRTTDFTPLCSIGQSSGLALELPHNMNLSNFEEMFPNYKENVKNINLEKGNTFSNNDLVPILHPPEGYELPYRMIFQISRLVQNGYIPGPNLDTKFYELVDPKKPSGRHINHSLEKLYNLKECCYDPVRWLEEQNNECSQLTDEPKSAAIYLDEGLVYVHRVQVTPARVYFCGPELNVSNCVLRHFKDEIDNFLRVSFVDEDFGKLYSKALLSKEGNQTKIYRRILETIRGGIKIGNKKFDFLAYSPSQLRDNSLWMFASTPTCDANRIRMWMGNFNSIRNVAKYAARLGQSFSSSIETLSVGEDEIDYIPDVEVISNGKNYVFSDGIGKISDYAARHVAKKCGVKGFLPSAFQIRYGGYKGVVARSSSSSMSLSLRPSMLKYDSNISKLDVLSWSKYQPCFLNRQIITLLSTLGVSDKIFEKKQREAVAQLDDILTNPSSAQNVLELMSPGENTDILKEILRCGYKPNEELFLLMMLQAFRSSNLFDLRTKTRIFIPDARQMMGCLDETGTLEYGQVFVQYTKPGNTSTHLVEGEVVVAKNPCLYPGDVRVLKAVKVEALHHMVDCVVFPQKGIRPHSDECSGSDLDGDLYFICWDPDLIPLVKDTEPLDYSPAPTIQLDHDVTIEEVMDHFTNFIIKDNVGLICTAHAVKADRYPEKAFAKVCVDLAKQFSIAVDSPKTGLSAEMPRTHSVNFFPDFMEKDGIRYISESVIGKLYREVKSNSPHTFFLKSLTNEEIMKFYDPDMEVDGFRQHIEKAFQKKKEYDQKLGNLMEYYGIKTEAEILSGHIMKTSNTLGRKINLEDIDAAVRSLRNETRWWYEREGGSFGGNVMASAMYHVTYYTDYWGNRGSKWDHFISFPWCVYDRLVRIKMRNTDVS